MANPLNSFWSYPKKTVLTTYEVRIPHFCESEYCVILYVFIGMMCMHIAVWMDRYKCIYVFLNSFI